MNIIGLKTQYMMSHASVRPISELCEGICKRSEHRQAAEKALTRTESREHSPAEASSHLIVSTLNKVAARLRLVNALGLCFNYESYPQTSLRTYSVQSRNQL